MPFRVIALNQESGLWEHFLSRTIQKEWMRAVDTLIYPPWALQFHLLPDSSVLKPMPYLNFLLIEERVRGIK